MFRPDAALGHPQHEAAAAACLLQTGQISALVNRGADAHKGASEQGLASYPCSGCPVANGKKGPYDLGVRLRLPYGQRLYRTPETCVLLLFVPFLPPMHACACTHAHCPHAACSC